MESKLKNQDENVKPIDNPQTLQKQDEHFRPIDNLKTLQN